MAETGSKLIILDRDGTINEDSDVYVKSADEWQPIPGALQAIARLNQAGWRVVIATNQSGLARGMFDMTALNAMHEKMQRLLAIEGGRVDAIFFCPHGPDDGCHCRKPKPGLFEQIAQRFRVHLQHVPAVGDSLRDLQAAASAGAIPHLVLTGKGRKTQADADTGIARLPEGTVIHEDLAAFADYLLK